MHRRIYGLENEYGITCTVDGARRLSPDEVARYLFRRVVSWGRSSNVFLVNGARLYLDGGSHPEYATPECDSVRDVITHDKAGERILEQLAASAEDRLREEGIDGDIFLFKNNTDSANNSYGCHENYMTVRNDDLSSYDEVIILQESWSVVRSGPEPERSSRTPVAGRGSPSASAPPTSGRASQAPRPGPDRSSTHATSRMPMQSGTDVST